MAEPYLVWALLVGFALGGALVWFVLGRLPRRSEDISPIERRAEADWISDVLASREGHAPPLLVEQVLELHEAYLAGPPIEISPEESAALLAELERREAEAQSEPEHAAEPGDPESSEAEPPSGTRH
jgi:hypothetical protein